MARFRQQQALGGRNRKFRFKNKLLSLDSNTISLCLALFPWAKFRRAGCECRSGLCGLKSPAWGYSDLSKSRQHQSKLLCRGSDWGVSILSLSHVVKSR